MTVMARPITPKGTLLLSKEILTEAGLGKQVRIIVKPGEIRIVTAPVSDAEATLKELAGCLGQEPASEYDFQLKIGGLYEAR
ncbi:MAG TPA: hypothetical protein PKZ84_02360 [Anaerolineae bacterium]|nr:hypothetical protein [Anaerolineae bacterium]HQI83158.1 hypothetical protein [Anaerolineae bacterium]